MKTKKYYLILAIVTGTLCVPALCDVKSPADRPASPGRVNPALTGIKGLYVVITPLYAEMNIDDPFWEQLKVKVEQRIVKAGIRTISEIYAGDVFRNYTIPVLRVNIDMLRLIGSQRYVCRIQTSLATDVRLEIDPSMFLKADVWTVGTTIQATPAQSMSATVTNSVLEQIEAFIAAWLAANPQAVQPTDARTGVAVSPATQKEQVKPSVKPAVAKYKYVASKNSKIFHKPGCSSAKRIKPENLVGYNSREEAKRAGKRPCKLCKP